MILSTEKCNIKKWISENKDVESVELVGKINADDIREYDDISKIPSLKIIDITKANVFFSDNRTWKAYMSDYESFCEPIPLILKLFSNLKYARKFVINNGLITSEDKRVLIHQPENEKIIIPQGTKIVGCWAFYGYKSKNIIIPNTVAEIGDNAFGDCEYMEELEIPNSVTKVGESSFANNEAKRITVSDNIEVFPKECFHYCTLTNLPRNLKRIEYGNAIEMDYDNVVLPPNIKYVDSWAFNYIFKFHFPASVKYIAEDFYYDDIDDREPGVEISIDKNNPYIFVTDNGEIGHKKVDDKVIQKDYSELAIDYISDEKTRKYLKKNVVLSPTEMLQLVFASSETSERRRSFFYNDLANTSILSDFERDLLDYLRNRIILVWDQLHKNSEDKYFVIYGINGSEETIISRQKYTHKCNNYIIENKLYFDYDKIICKQYSESDPDAQNVLGQYEYNKERICINNVSFILPPIPEKYAGILGKANIIRNIIKKSKSK